MNQKVTIRGAGETPPEDTTQQAAVSADGTEILTDFKGRKITLKNPGTLAQYRLVRMLPPEVARNDAYVNMLIPLQWVTAIDDDPVTPPASEREFEALITRLGDEGVAAIILHQQQQFERLKEAAEVAANAAKKSQGTTA